MSSKQSGNPNEYMIGDTFVVAKPWLRTFDVTLPTGQQHEVSAAQLRAFHDKQIDLGRESVITNILADYIEHKLKQSA